MAGHLDRSARLGPALRLSFWMAAAIFPALAALALAQAFGSRLLVSDADSPGAGEPVTVVRAPLAAGAPGRLYPELRVPALRSVKALPPPTLSFDLPPTRTGYVLNVGVRFMRHDDPVRVAVQLDGRPLGEFRARSWYEPERAHQRDAGEIQVPADLLAPDRNHRLTFENQAGPWIGRILLIPFGAARHLLQIGLPVAGALLLLASSAFAGPRWRTARPPLVFAVLLVVYAYTLFAKKLAPTDGFFWDDAVEYIHSILDNAITFKIAKHLLLLPVVQPIYALIHALIPAELAALTLAFALVAALNGVAAFLFFRSRFDDDVINLSLTVAYAFSFSVWAYASLFESYILSALVVNLFLLTLDLTVERRLLWRHLPAGLLVILAGLAHPPLLILVGVLWVLLLFTTGPRRERIGAAAAVTALVGVGYLIGRIAIRAAYPEPDDEFIQAATVPGEFRFVAEMISMYASVAHLSFANLGNVVLGQFAYAFGGFPYAFSWFQGWSGAAAYLHSVPGAAFALTLGWLWIAFGTALLRSDALRVRTLALAIVVGVPYLRFYWYFNPEEMLLYTAPFVAPVLAWLATGATAVPSAHPRVLLPAFAAATVALNTAVLVSYH